MNIYFFEIVDFKTALHFRTFTILVQLTTGLRVHSQGLEVVQLLHQHQHHSQLHQATEEGMVPHPVSLATVPHRANLVMVPHRANLAMVPHRANQGMVPHNPQVSQTVIQLQEHLHMVSTPKETKVVGHWYMPSTTPPSTCILATI